MKAALERGSALVVTLAIVAILLVLAATLLLAVNTGSMEAMDRESTLHVRQGIETAIGSKVHALTLDENDVGPLTLPLPKPLDGAVVVTTSGAPPSWYYLRAVATYKDANGNEGSSRVDVVLAKTQTSPFRNGFLGVNELKLNTNGILDAWDSSVGDYATTTAPDGKFASNGAVTVSTPGISGHLALGPAGTVNDTTLVSGEVTSLSESSFVFSPVSTAEAEASNDNGTVVLEGGATLVGNTLKASGSDAVIRLLPGTYYFDEISVTASAAIVLDPTVTRNDPVLIYVSGPAKLAGYGVANPSQDPGGFQLCSSHVGAGAVQVAGTSAFYGAVHAPQGDVSVVGGGGLFGAVNASRLDASGGAALHFDKSLAELGVGAGQLGTSSWREVP